MIQTDFILVDGEKKTKIPVTDRAKKSVTDFYYIDDVDVVEDVLIQSGYTVTVLDRATMTRDEQREVFMLTKDVSFLSYETVMYWMDQSDELDNQKHNIKNYLPCYPQTK